MSSNKNTNNDDVVSPSWQVLELVSYHLDPKTLAISSCVSKSWLSCFSSHHLWDPLCSSHFPSLSSLPTSTTTTIPVSSRRLYGLGYTASRLRNRLPRKPTLSLDDLLFTITIHIPPTNNNNNRTLLPIGGQSCINNSNNNSNSTVLPGAGLSCTNNSNSATLSVGQYNSNSNVLRAGQSNNNDKNRGGSGRVMSVVKACKDLKRDPQGTFRFDVEVEDEREWGMDELEGVRVTWNVVDKEWKAVFGMAEESGVKKGGFASCADGWFSEELPTPWCCSGAMSSGLVADLRLEMTPPTTTDENDKKKKMRVEKVKVGVMCILNWRYLSVDDALSYLDHFLHV